MRRPETLRIAVLLTAVVAFGPISTDLYLPSLPGIGRHFGTDAAAVQLTLSVFLLGFAGGQIIYGPLSDRFGRRPVLISGIVVYLAASMACVIAESIEALIGARFFQALGACSGVVLARAIVRDIYPPERAGSVLAYMGSAMAVAPMIGPVIGGQLEINFGWRANFMCLLAFAAAILLSVIGILDETNKRLDPSALAPRRMLGNFREMLASSRYVGCLTAASFCYSGLFAFISASSFVLIDVVGLMPDAFGLCFSIMVAGYMLGAISAGRLIQRLGLDRTMLVGSCLTAFGGPLMAIMAIIGMEDVKAAAIVVPMMFYAAGVGLVMPATTAAAIGPYPEKAGAASSLLGLIQMCIAASVGATVAHILDGTARPMAFAIAACGILTLGAVLMLRRRG
ncbi:MAG: multidrug effflux MFS transporter [Alphaproteobacteria bacterium]|nr:multidrug effflux MFS transporter [Alphaproteobacteria bacterium]